MTFRRWDTIDACALLAMIKFVFFFSVAASNVFQLCNARKPQFVNYSSCTLRVFFFVLVDKIRWNNGLLVSGENFFLIPMIASTKGIKWVLWEYLSIWFLWFFSSLCNRMTINVLSFPWASWEFHDLHRKTVITIAAFLSGLVLEILFLFKWTYTRNRKQ